MEEINLINSTLQDIDNRIVYLLDKLNYVEGGGSVNTEEITTLKNTLETTQQNITLLNEELTNVKTRVSTNETYIDNLQNGSGSSVDLTEIETRISELETLVSELDNKVAEIETKVLTNETNIKEINTTLSSIDTESIEELANTVNDMKEVVDNFITIIKDRNKILNTEYNGIDQNAVYTTYDFIENTYTCEGTGNLNSGVIGFSNHTSSTTAKIRITVQLKGAENGGSGKFGFKYNENSTVYEHFNYSTELNIYTFEFDVDVSSGQNYFYYVVITDNNIPITFTYGKSEIYNCTNPMILSKNNPFDVTKLNNKYYICDCSGNTAKYAIIDVHKLTTMNDLTWVDTGIAARKMFAQGHVDTTAFENPIDCVSFAYLLKNNKVDFHNSYTGNVASYSSYTISSIYPCKPTSTYYGYIYTNYYSAGLKKGNIRYNADDSKTTGNLTADNNSLFYMPPKSQADDINSSIGNVYIKQNLNGTLTASYANTRLCELGYGQVVSAYYVGNTLTEFNVYVKVIDKLVKHYVKYVSNVLTLMSSEVIGDYDCYFEGVNDDYFVVKNNKLYYYKNNLQEVTE